MGLFISNNIVLVRSQRKIAYFFLNNQQDAQIIQIYSVIKLCMLRHLLCQLSGVFYCTFGTGKFQAGFWWPLAGRVRMEQ